MHRFPYVYVCGVSKGPITERRERNLHMPLAYAPGGVAELDKNGYCFRAENAVLVEVPQLPDDFGGLPREHARCRNFQFGVSQFGYPRLPRARRLD